MLVIAGLQIPHGMFSFWGQSWRLIFKASPRMFFNLTFGLLLVMHRHLIPGFRIPASPSGNPALIRG